MPIEGKLTFEDGSVYKVYKEEDFFEDLQEKRQAENDIYLYEIASDLP